MRLILLLITIFGTTLSIDAFSAEYSEYNVRNKRNEPVDMIKAMNNNRPRKRSARNKPAWASSFSMFDGYFKKADILKKRIQDKVREKYPTRYSYDKIVIDDFDTSKYATNKSWVNGLDVDYVMKYCSKYNLKPSISKVIHSHKYGKDMEVQNLLKVASGMGVNENENEDVEVMEKQARDFKILSSLLKIGSKYQDSKKVPSKNEKMEDALKLAKAMGDKVDSTEERMEHMEQDKLVGERFFKRGAQLKKLTQLGTHHEKSIDQICQELNEIKNTH